MFSCQVLKKKNVIIIKSNQIGSLWSMPREIPPLFYYISSKDRDDSEKKKKKKEDDAARNSCYK